MPDEHLPTQALVPVDQDTVTLFAQPITAVRLPDGQIAAVFTDLCRALGLERAPQARRVRADDTIGDQLLFAMVHVPDGTTQPMDVLTAWAVPMWLQGLQVSRLAPEKRPAILAFKREAADVLYRHFAHRQPTLPMPSTLVPAEPIARPEAPGVDASLDDWRTYHEAMIAWIDWQREVDRWRRDMEQRQGTLEQRVGAVEEVARLVPELIERLGPPTVTPEHQHTVQRGVKRLHELTGRPYPSLYAELCDAFRIARYDQLPEARWEEVAAWFRERVARASGHQGQPPEQGSLF
jgi:hypothetical protein